MATDIALSDYIAIQNTAFNWTKAYDTKDFTALQTTLAPSGIRLDLRGVGGKLHENLTPSDYAALLSGPHMLGDKRVKTQHLLGGARFEKLEDDSVHVMYQTRAAHQRFEDDMRTVVNKGHGYGFVQHWYRRIEGEWKIEASESSLEWSEYDLWGTVVPPKDGGEGGKLNGQVDGS